MTMTKKQNQVFLSELQQRTQGTRTLILQGRGRCLVDEFATQRPINQRPVCSVYAVIAKYLSMSGIQDGSLISPTLATSDAKKRTARALGERFLIMGKNQDGRKISRDELIQSFVAQLENELRASAPRYALEDLIANGIRKAVVHLILGKTFKGIAFNEGSVFDDTRNLIRPITPDEIVYGVGGNPLRLSVNAMRMLRESIVLDVLLSRRWEPSFAEHLILMVDKFAREQLTSGRIISCRQCKQGKDLAIPKSDGGPLWWRNRGNPLMLRDGPEVKGHDPNTSSLVSSGVLQESFTACPTRGFRSRSDLDDDNGITAGFEIHGGPAHTDDWQGLDPKNANVSTELIERLSGALGSDRPKEPRPNWPEPDPRMAERAPWDLVPDKTEKGKDKKKGE